ncbi:hypothetical protein [Absidia glauca]|uniref:Uncharacterized protein n=1 Tax=Absidia glauca TaxID=4829 RepID=A0A163JMJ2_ABSGL|nr:hypothetical protein [Absidia glauca]
MASLLWKQQQQQRSPSTLFSSTTTLSPRQVANKAYSLAIKKLDRDDKRSRPRYNVRERLLLCHTLTHAEQFLQKRTARTNRRVMAFEDDDDAFDNALAVEQQQQQEQQQPLLPPGDDAFIIPHDDEEDQHIQQHYLQPPPPSLLLPMGNNAFIIPQDEDDFLPSSSPVTSSFLIPTSDCRLLSRQPHLASPIASII